MPSEVSIDNEIYRIKDMDAIRQFHIWRRLAPVVAESGQLLKLFQQIAVGGIDSVTSDDPFSTIKPVAAALSELPDKDADYVVKNCLAFVERKLAHDSGWAGVVSSSGALMYSDIQLPTMMRIVWAVLESQLSSFFSAPPSA